MKIEPNIFRAYDIRGLYPKEIDSKVGYRLARAIATFLKPKNLAVGRDIRNSSKEICQPAIKGLLDSGVDVIDIGEISTEMLYFAVPHLKTKGGIVLTASHNPPGWAGMKLVREKGIPISGETGIKTIEKLANQGKFPQASQGGKVTKKDVKPNYYKKLESLVDFDQIKPLSIAIDALNGIAGQIIEPILKKLPLEVIRVNFNPNGNFPKGQPDPLLPKMQIDIKKRVKETGADLGIAFDGDADRIFFFDEKGRFVPSCYVVALLAEYLLKKSPAQEKVVHETRLIWAIRNRVKKAGGIPIEIRVGHSFFKEKMREEDALFAGESTGHFFYRDFNYSDSGLLTFLYFLEYVSQSKKPISKIFAPIEKEFPVIHEINFVVEDINRLTKKVERQFGDGKIEHIDGTSIETKEWRFNLRGSQNEPLVRLNLEAVDLGVLKKKKAELIDFIQKQGGKIKT